MVPSTRGRKAKPRLRKHGFLTASSGTDLAEFVHPSRVPNPGEPHHIINYFPSPGAQAMVTPTVKKFASQFGQPHNIRDISTVIGQVRQQIALRRVPVAVARELYARRTATDIIHSKASLTLEKGAEKVVPMYGCVDHGLALTATLRALQIPSFFARRGQRTMVFFRFKGKNYYVDPSRHTKSPEPQEMSHHDSRVFEHLRETGAFNRGRDAWDIGMASIQDFNKYVSIFDRFFGAQKKT